MISERMEEALNSQINAEYFSSYLYLAMAAHCEAVNLKGFASWLRIQVLEENAHMMKFFEYVLERGGQVKLGLIEAPASEWDSPAVLFDAVLEHERYITKRINKLVDLAVEDNDHATNNFLQWFVAEQVEEEASADEILQQLKMVESHPGGLFLLDRELGQRVFTPPAE